MLLNRVKASSQRALDVMRSPFFVKWLPLLLVGCLVLYILIGSLAFYLIEDGIHEYKVRKWRSNMDINRRMQARHISQRIFNDTRNLLIIIDKEQTERVQHLLVDSLKTYEHKIELVGMQRHEWDFLNSFNYAYSLLLTLGHGTKIPGTLPGQIFALLYAMVGIPLFYATLGLLVYRLLCPLLQSVSCAPTSRRIFGLAILKLVYIIWNFLLALYLYEKVFPNDFWMSMLVAFISGLTVQIPKLAMLDSVDMWFLLMANTVTSALVIACLIIFAAIVCPAAPCFKTHRRHPVVDRTESIPQPQKFTIIVDEAGESKLGEARKL
ncbi:hypothetical protein WR25_00055 [Diploscapter pachys]|uniref:Potassium channel domain-containing protein n=1 Tax=Diploscapter pachys TaxID=2018661 RepID=A0A2A2KEE1_9BILA|nr:hypothetical protein WR25_00055 [Diploscapter pachys]